MRFLHSSLLVLALGGCSQGIGGRPDAGNPGYGGGFLSPNAVLIDPHNETVYAVKSVEGAVPDTELPTAPLRPTLEPGCDAAVDADGAADIDATGDLDAITALDVPDAGVHHNEIYRIDPNTGTTARVSAFGDDQTVALSFLQSRLLYDIASANSVELRLQDPGTLGVLARQPVDLAFTVFWDSLSPSELYLASNGLGPRLNGAPDTYDWGMGLFLADTRTLEIHGTRCGAGTPTWLHTGDRFLVLTTQPTGATGMHHHLRQYAVADLQRLAFATAGDGSWQGATLELDTDLTDVVVSPDDQWLAGAAESGGVSIVNLGGAARHIDGVNGPVIFTPSGSMLVAWRGAPNADAGVGADAGDSSLVLIDVATGTTTAIDTGFSSAPVYFVSSDGHRIVIFSIESDIPRVDGGVAGASVQLAVADLDLHSMNASVLIDRPAPALGTFVDRRGHDELWFLHPDDGQLDRLDLVSGAYEVVPVSFRARGIGYLPVHDLIVFGEDSPPAVRFWDPSTRATVRDVPF